MVLQGVICLLLQQGVPAQDLVEWLEEDIQVKVTITAHITSIVGDNLMRKL